MVKCILQKRVWTTRANQLHQIHKADLNSDSSCTMRSNAYYRRGSEPLEQISCTKFTKLTWTVIPADAVKCILQKRVWTTRVNQIHKADLNSTVAHAVKCILQERVWTTRANQLHQIHKADLNSDSSCTMRSNAYYRRGSEPLEQTSCTKFTKLTWTVIPVALCGQMHTTEEGLNH